MRSKRKDFDDAGAKVLVIDPHESYRVRHMLREAGFAPQDLRVPVLADPAHSVSAIYGVAFQMQIHTEWSNRPAAFIIDRQGIIRFVHRGKRYPDRPTPDDLLGKLVELRSRAAPRTP